MKKQLLQERFQQLAGIKPIYGLNEDREMIDEKFKDKLKRGVEKVKNVATNKIKGSVDLEKSLKKPVPGFRKDLSRFMDDPKVKAVLSMGDQDGEESDDKMPYSETELPIANLKPTQTEIGFDQSVMGNITDKYNSLGGILSDNVDVGGPIVTYDGKYIIDGHHRWSAVFTANPTANMKSLDIKAKAGFGPTDVLKAVHSAIALELDKVPGANPKGINIMGGVDYKSVRDKVEGLTDKAAKEWAKHDYKTKEQIAQQLTKNINKIASKGHVPGAPGRKDMPQTDADKSDSEDKLKTLATGKVNISPPFTKGDKELKETKNKTMKQSELRSLIREQIKRTLREAAVGPPPLPGKKSGPPPLPSKEEQEKMKTMTDLGNKFLAISREMKGSKLKGIDTAEIKALDAFVDQLLHAAQEESLTPLIQRMGKMIK